MKTTEPTLRAVRYVLILAALAANHVFPDHTVLSARRYDYCSNICGPTVPCWTECQGTEPPYYTTCGEYNPNNCDWGSSCPDWDYDYQAIGAWGVDNYDWVYHDETWFYEMVSCTHRVTYHVTKTDLCGQQATQEFCTYGEPTVVNTQSNGWCCCAYQGGGTYDQCDI